MNTLSPEYLEFKSSLQRESNQPCSACKKPLNKCRCSRSHTSFALKVPKAGNPDNILDYGNVQNTKINKAYFGDNE